MMYSCEPMEPQNCGMTPRIIQSRLWLVCGTVPRHAIRKLEDKQAYCAGAGAGHGS